MGPAGGRHARLEGFLTNGEPRAGIAHNAGCVFAISSSDFPTN